MQDAPGGSLAASPGVHAIDAFAKLGSRTGGRSFEGGRQPLSPDEVLGVLLRIRDEALARVHSQYRVGFAPGNAASPAREHKLEVSLVTKSVGKVTGGKRRVIY